MWSQDDRAQWILENTHVPTECSYACYGDQYFMKYYSGPPWYTSLGWHSIYAEDIPPDRLIHVIESINELGDIA